MEHSEEEYEDYEEVEIPEGLSGLVNLPLRTYERGFFFEQSMADIFVMGFCLFFALVIGAIIDMAAIQLFGGSSALMSEVFPTLQPLHSKIDQFFMGKSPALFITLCLPFLIGSIYGAFYFGETALDAAWGAPLDQTPAQKLNSYWLVLTLVVPPSMAIAFTPIYMSLTGMGALPQVGVWLLSLPVMVGLIGVSYKILSNGFITWKSSFSGSLHAAIPYTLLSSLLLGVAIPKLLGPGKDLLFVAMVLFVWSIASSIILYYGARNAVVCERESFGGEFYEDDWADDRSRKEVALICLLELTKRFSFNSFDSNKIGLHPYELSCLAQVTPTHAMSVIGQLHQVGLVSILNDGEGNVAMLNFNPQNLIMADFLKRMEYPDDQEAPDTLDVYTNKYFWNRYYAVIDDTFNQLTLQELYDRSLKDHPPKDIKQAG